MRGLCPSLLSSHSFIRPIQGSFLLFHTFIFIFALMNLVNPPPPICLTLRSLIWLFRLYIPPSLFSLSFLSMAFRLPYTHSPCPSVPTLGGVPYLFCHRYVDYKYPPLVTVPTIYTIFPRDSLLHLPSSYCFPFFYSPFGVLSLMSDVPLLIHTQMPSNPLALLIPFPLTLIGPIPLQLPLWITILVRTIP